MKRARVVLPSLCLALTLLVSCAPSPIAPAQTTEASQTASLPSCFICSDGGYSIEFPDSWTGRFCISVSGSRAEFYQSAVHGGDSGFPGRIFSVHLYESSEHPELNAMEPGEFFYPDAAPWEHMLLGRNGEYAIVAAFPSDMQIPLEGTGAEAIGAEYNAMQADIRALNFTLRTFAPARG